MKRLKILPFTMKYNLYTFHILFQLIIKIFSGSGHNHNNHLIKSAKICSANSPPVLVLTGRITSSFPRTVHSASVSNPSMVNNFCRMVICLFTSLLEHGQTFLKNKTQAKIEITISLPEEKSTSQFLN